MCTTPVPSTVVTKSASVTYQAFWPVSRIAGISNNGSYSRPIKSAPFTLSFISYFLSPITVSTLSFAKIEFSPSTSTNTYSISFPTAKATFPGNVHGVVVHAKIYVGLSFGIFTLLNCRLCPSDKAARPKADLTG